MKKLAAIFAVVLTLALLLGAVVGVSASAAEDTPAAQADEKWVISANVAYADDIHPYFAIDANLVADASLLSVKVDGKSTVIDPEPVAIKAGVYAYVVEAAGVAAKNMSKELPIVVTYNGEVVEETTYSVAEYFYERLYRNDVINATEADDLLRKELYLATLEYGAAAQKVVPGSTATTLIKDLNYVTGEGVVTGFYAEGAIIAVEKPDAPLGFIEYGADGSAIGGGYFDKAGSFYVRGNLVVKGTKSASSDFSELTELPATGDAIGDLTFVDSIQADSLAEGSILTDEAYGNYIHISDPYSKTVGKTDAEGNVTYGGGQPIFRFARSLDGVVGNTVVVEVVMRFADATGENLAKTWAGSNVDFSLGYGGAANNTRSHRIYINNSVSKGFEIRAGGVNDKAVASSLTKASDWFTLRIVHSAEGSTYDEEKFWTQVYIDNVLISESSLRDNNKTSDYAPADQITSLSILPSSDYIGSVDVAKVTFSQINSAPWNQKTELKDLDGTGLDFTGRNHVSTTENGIETSFTNGSKETDKGEINYHFNLPAEKWLYIEDNSKSQTYIDFTRTAVDGSSKFVFEADLAIDQWATNPLNISLRNKRSGDKLEYVYAKTVNNKIAFSFASGSGYKTSDVAVGEWFNLRIEISTTDSADTLKVDVIVNGESFIDTTISTAFSSAITLTPSSFANVRFVADSTGTYKMHIDNVKLRYEVPSV